MLSDEYNSVGITIDRIDPENNKRRKKRENYFRIYKDDKEKK